jgi:pimeloyl-ACP methyl ester carboxylesterase
VRPTLMVGASAGAWQAVLAALRAWEPVRAIVIEACAAGYPNIDWSRRRHPSGALFPVAPMYRALIEHVLTPEAHARLNATTELKVAIAHPPAWAPGVLAPLVGIGAYQLEKRLFRPVHPRFGRALGFTPRFISARETVETTGLVDAVLASATVPPIMPVIRLGGRPALDGGLVDNVPVEPLAPIEAAGGRTLVLLSRTYPNLPDVPGRLYVAPSEPIAVKQFDITNADGIRAAVALGHRDGAALVRRLSGG